MWAALGRIGLVTMITAATIPDALAQRVIFDAPGITGQKKGDQLPTVRAQPTVWPRLDPGAVLCRTEYDLDRHASNMTARVSGAGTSAADCRIIGQPVGIQILSRQGLGRTEVRLSSSDGATGWTDAWLPDKAPTTR
jgi:hypothetical protein